MEHAHKQPSIEDFLCGKAFSNALQLKIPDQPYITRLELLEKLVTDRKVIHLGFADHRDLILKKIKENSWLHKRLMDASKKCVGVDIDAETVDFVRKELGLTEVYCFDVTKDDIPQAIRNEKWDYLLLGEVLEHIDNPVQFLSSLRERFSNIANSVIITAPNALRIANFELALRGIEAINSDHRYWFTPYTLMKIVARAGYRIENLYLVESFNNQSNHYLVSKIPLLRDDIVLICKF